MKNYFDFTGKVAVVTGASSGLGADAAKAYAECGASVALLARRKEKLAGVAEEIKSLGGKVITVACDVTDEQMVKAAVDEVISSLGRIDILSVNAIIGDKVPVLARHSYNASKAGVRGLTLGMAASYGMYGITVNCVGPGLFESEMTENTLFKNEQFMKAYNSGNPMGRPGRRGELNGTILYLSSDASSYVTGQYIVVDGGMSEV